MGYKQIILVRKELKLPKGKMAVQCSHAAVEAVLKSQKDDVKRWRDSGGKKVAVYVDNLKELYKFNQLAKDIGLVTAVITDAGKTVLEPGTVTCMAIGPDEEQKIDKLTSKLKMV